MEIQEKTLKKRIAEKGVKMTWIAEQLDIKYPTLMSYINGFRIMPTGLNNKILDLINK